MSLAEETEAGSSAYRDRLLTLAEERGGEAARAFAAAYVRRLSVEGISLSLWDFRMQDGSPTKVWEYTNGASCGAEPTGGDEMESLMEDGNDIVVARVCYTQDAIIGTMFGSGTIELDDELMLRPRQSTMLDCTDCPG